MAFEFDLIVIGAGSGGVRASRISAGHGARVAVIEESRPGGTCVIRGCVPKKLLMYGSAFSADAADAAGYGWQVSVDGHDWPALIAAKNAELDRLEGIYRSLLTNAGVELIEGRGIVTGPNSVRVGDRELTAERILVATGGWPQIPDVPGLADHAITSNEALDLAERPESVVVYGAGYIAVEFASIFNGFGIETHLVYRADLPLRGFDQDIRSQSAEALAGRGIILHPGCTVERVENENGRKAVTLSDGTGLVVSEIMAATGRVPNTAGLGLEAAGVELGRKGEVMVDAGSQSSVPSIYAVGDVTDRIALTPVAIAEGHALADTLTPGEIGHQIGCGSLDHDVNRIVNAVYAPADWTPSGALLDGLLKPYSESVLVTRWQGWLQQLDALQPTLVTNSVLRSRSLWRLRWNRRCRGLLRVVNRLPVWPATRKG